MQFDPMVMVLFLGGQLATNIAVLFSFGSRLVRVETHLVHLMKKHGMTLRSDECAED
jgi:hypothetical protein